MTSMVERLARAIYEAQYPNEKEHWPSSCEECQRHARAVLKELQEPTDEMAQAGNDAWMRAIGHEDKDAEDIWQAMIDKALEE